MSRPVVAKKQTQVRDLRWDDAQLFLAVWREGSLKRAAAALQVNISTVSRRLDGLESALGAHLFDRTPDGTLPTLAATRLFPFAEAMEQAAIGFASGLSGLEAEPKGVVHVTAPPGVVDHFLAPALPELGARYPELRLEISSSVDYLDLTRRQADIALRVGRPSGGDLVGKRLVASGWCALASPERAASVGRLRDAARHPWISWGRDLAHLPDAAWLLERLPPERLVLRTSSMTGQIEAVRAGLGLMLATRPYAELRGLAEVPCSRPLRRALDELPRGELWIIGHRAHRHVPRVAAVWGWLTERFEARRAPE